MIHIILLIGSFLIKNTALIIGILEAACKAISGVITLTPTKRDDAFLPKIDEVFSAIKRALYNLSDFMAGKD